MRATCTLRLPVLVRRPTARAPRLSTRRWPTWARLPAAAVAALEAPLKARTLVPPAVVQHRVGRPH